MIFCRAPWLFQALLSRSAPCVPSHSCATCNQIHIFLFPLGLFDCLDTALHPCLGKRDVISIEILKSGKGTAGWGKTGVERTGQDRAGQDSAGQDRIGQGRAGQDRAMQVEEGRRKREVRQMEQWLKYINSIVNEQS